MKNVRVLVFSSVNCKPCKIFKQKLLESRDLKWEEVLIEDDIKGPNSLTKQLHITSVPSTVIMIDDKPSKTLIGTIPVDAIKREIAHAKI